MSNKRASKEPGVLAPYRPRHTPPEVVMAGLARCLRLALELEPAEEGEEGEEDDYEPAGLSRSPSHSGA